MEREKSDNLLLNILPKEIAEILKNQGGTIANHYDNVSILFADLVNFTPLSAEVSPNEMVGLLNEIFSHFDSLIDLYGLEKIETVGDGYMAACGVPRPHPQYAQALARLALDMSSYMASLTRGMKDVWRSASGFTRGRLSRVSSGAKSSRSNCLATL
ncbi:MAG TPA: adenylate/guanylate cyclase domain-containing protein [Anaerolineae bacterium]